MGQTDSTDIKKNNINILKICQEGNKNANHIIRSVSLNTSCMLKDKVYILTCKEDVAIFFLFTLHYFTDATSANVDISHLQNL